MLKNNDIYKMYEEEFYKVEKLNKIINKLRLELNLVKSENNRLKNNIKSEINKAIKTLAEENIKLKEDLNNALKEIERLKSEKENKMII